MPLCIVRTEGNRLMQSAIRSAPERPRGFVPESDAAVLSVVVPVFNECDCLPQLYERLLAATDSLGIEYEIVFVNDGSADGSEEILNRWAEANPRITVLHFSRNFGHQPAVAAGLEYATGSAVVVLDGDLQDPPEVIASLLERWREGCDVVYAVRTRRKESLFKRAGYFAFYRLLRLGSTWEIPLDSGDFCLMDRRALDAMLHLPEKDRFIRGLRAFVGFRQIGVPYERAERGAGQTKYSISKLVSLAIDGFVSTGEIPIRWILGGVLVSFLAAIAFSIALGIRWAAVGLEPEGWMIVLAVVLGLFSVQVAAFGMLGTYVLKIFAEVKRRPSYILREVRKCGRSSISRAA